MTLEENLDNPTKIDIYETMDFLAEKYRACQEVSVRLQLDLDFYALIDIVKQYYAMPRREVSKMMDYYNKKKIML